MLKTIARFVTCVAVLAHGGAGAAPRVDGHSQAPPPLDISPDTEEHRPDSVGEVRFVTSRRDQRALPRFQNVHKIALWGDSHTASGVFADAMAQTWGLQRERTLPSFVPPSLGVSGVRLPFRKNSVSAGWQVSQAYRSNPKPAEFSKGLISLTSAKPGSEIWMDFRFPTAETRVKWMNLVYSKLRLDSALVLGVSVDEGPEQIVSLTRAVGPRLQIIPPAPMSSLRLRLIAGQITIDGFEPVYASDPGAILDVFSVPGATSKGLEGLDPIRSNLWEYGVGSYDIAILQFGTNEGLTKNLLATDYTRQLRANLTRFRQAYPASRCILVGPPDRGTSHRSGENSFALGLHIVNQVQKNISGEFKCEFWDWQSAVGGPGTADRWLKSSPAMMQHDLTHLTPAGYELSGKLFAGKFLLKSR